MARIKGATCGWETGISTETGLVTTAAGGTFAVVTSTPTPASGTYCAKCSSTVNINGQAYVQITFPATTSEIWARFRVYPHIVGTPVNFILWEAYDSGNAILDSLFLDPTSNLLRMYRTSGAALLGAGNQTIVRDAWNLIEVHLKVNASTGIAEIWLNNNQIMNLTGQNTSTNPIFSCRLGMADGQTIDAGSYLGLDDLAVNDTTGSINNGRCGDSRIAYLPANGAGTNTNLTRGGTDTGANWSQVSPVPIATTSYVLSSTATTRDTYALADLPVNAVSVNCVEEIVQAENSDAGIGSVGLTTKSGATTTEATAIGLGTSWQIIRNLLETDPNTSAAWTVANVNALEAGVTVE